jgi:hypothetical protein
MVVLDRADGTGRTIGQGRTLAWPRPRQWHHRRQAEAVVARRRSRLAAPKHERAEVETILIDKAEVG